MYEYDEIAERVERLSPETRALFWELQARGVGTEFRVPAEELVIHLHQRMRDLPPEDQAEFINIHRDIARRAEEEAEEDE
jgi:hypothetical protein